MNRKAVSDYLKAKGFRCEPTTLAKYACLDGGPAYRLAGRFPDDTAEDLDEWAEARMSEPITSTAELRRTRPPAAPPDP